MMALVQRVKHAKVDIGKKTVGEIGKGMLVLLGVHRDDSLSEVQWVVKKVAHLRIFPDDEGKMNKSLLDINGDVLVVSQFTLYGDTRKGNRPSFIASAPPTIAEPLYEQFVKEMEQWLDSPVQTGQFGAMMEVHLVNDGPVTLVVEKRNEK